MANQPKRKLLPISVTRISQIPVNRKYYDLQNHRKYKYKESISKLVDSGGIKKKKSRVIKSAHISNILSFKKESILSDVSSFNELSIPFCKPLKRSLLTPSILRSLSQFNTFCRVKKYNTSDLDFEEITIHSVGSVSSKLFLINNEYILEKNRCKLQLDGKILLNKDLTFNLYSDEKNVVKWCLYWKFSETEGA